MYSPTSATTTPVPLDDGSCPPPKKKQKRNKPTLSCDECVERKTKCDRGRPNCIACTKRQSICNYAASAATPENTYRSESPAIRIVKPPKKRFGLQSEIEGPKQASNPEEKRKPQRLFKSSIELQTLLSHVPYSHPTGSNVFENEHPFANYWTCEGGLPETIGVLPEKLQADILLDRYFECVDPVYPMIHRQTFYADYEHFWSLPQAEKDKSDGAFISMIFAMLAMGAQFVTTTPTRERQSTAEFYVPASNQSLRMSSYLSKASVRSIQAMVLITYFLINDNHASDGWAFAGILVRQAYAMGLHRDPNIIVPNASIFEKQIRRKLWQAVLLQDTFLTVLLSLPPSATHTDVNVEDLIDDSSSIAQSNATDTAYMRGSWMLANLVQETICSPRSLDIPICGSARIKAKLVADFRSVYRSFPDIFRSWTPASMAQLCEVGNKRVVRQTLFLTSNYFHNVMLLHSSVSEEVVLNVRACLEAAHEAISSFFLLHLLFQAEAQVWWVFHHRAFLEAMCIGKILQEQAKEENGLEILARDSLLIRAKGDVVKMIDIMNKMGEGEHGSVVAKSRAGVLSQFLE